MEKRYITFDSLEVRADTDGGDGNTLVGYAALFNNAADFGDWEETILPGAFDNSLSTNNSIRALFEHDSSRLLGRSDNNTLKLNTDEKGLKVSIRPNMGTTHGRDVLALVRRGDISGMSFGFLVPEGGDRIDKVGQKYRRTLTQIDLREVTVTSIPAYEDTSLSVRIDPQLQKDISAMKEAECNYDLELKKRRLEILEAEAAL